MGITLTGSTLAGIITSSEAHHLVNAITNPTQYAQIGVVTNTPRAAINNGAIVSLASASTWTVTGTSYLTKLTLSSNSRVVPASGHTVSMTVDGVATTILPGNTYSGAIVLTVQ